MGCFSYICKGCKTPINSNSFNGEQCDMFLLQDGVVIESMSGAYNSYGATFKQEWEMDWGDVCSLHFNLNDGDGIAAFHSKCFEKAGRVVPTTISDDDPDQGWGNMRKRFMG